jgi:hypothetical protein
MGSVERERLLLDIKLLRKSIHKWSLISVGLGVEHGIENCALCQYYEYPCERNHIECPVNSKTGFTLCSNTPHEEWCNHMYNKHNKYWMKCEQSEVQCGECRTIANKELMFLQGLLEEYKEKLNTRKK